MNNNNNNNNNNNDENFMINKPFLATLRDAVIFAKLANEANEKCYQNVLAKAAIIHCAFCVEALANNMIQFMNFGSKFSDSIEKLDPISKMELFCLLIKKESIDRGIDCVQTLKAFIDLRNSYVHPKIKVVKDNDEGKEYQKLNLQRNVDKWTAGDAMQCIKSLLKGIDAVLLDVIKLEKNSMSCMFLEQLSIEGMRGPIIPHDHDWAIWVKTFLKYKVRFYFDHILLRFEEHIDCVQAKPLIGCKKEANEKRKPN